MKTHLISAIAFFSILLNISIAQESKDNQPKASVDRLQHYVYALAHDSLRGREAGTDYERSAANFIAGEFEKHGLKPFFGDTAWFQEFPLRQRVFIDRGSRLHINTIRYFQNIDFYPVLFSTSGDISGKVIYSHIASPPDSCIWMFRLSFPETYTDSTLLAKTAYICDITKTAEENGITGLIILGNTDSLNFYIRNIAQTACLLPIPAVFLESTKTKGLDLSQDIEAELQVRFYRPPYLTAINVAGIIDNKAKHTVVIGAHYDHVGMGYFNSLTGERAIHNGADDNASGTAALLELASMMTNETFSNYNYLFIAFGGEENGLTGSRYFISHSPGSDLKYNCMINIDMIGRPDPALMMVASGSSRDWKRIADGLQSQSPELKRVKHSFAYSDHAWFLREKIPAVQFFTGLHGDYHRPSDIAQKINYKGMQEIVNLIHEVLISVENRKTLKYRRSKPWDKWFGTKYYKEQRQI